jgi:hypothetical protein
VFASARIGERLAPEGTNTYQRVDRGFSIEAGQATSITTRALFAAPNLITEEGAGQTIDATYVPAHSTLVTEAVQLVSAPVTQATGQGRSAAQSRLGIGASGLPNPYFVPAGGAFSVQQGAGITVTPVYGPYTGIPPRNESGQIDPNAMELKGWWIYNGPAPTASSSPLAQRLIQNVTQWIAIDTTVETDVTVSDVDLWGSPLSRSIEAQNSIVQAGADEDTLVDRRPFRRPEAAPRHRKSNPQAPQDPDLRRSHQRPRRPHRRALRPDRQQAERRGDNPLHRAPTTEGVGGG